MVIGLVLGAGLSYSLLITRNSTQTETSIHTSTKTQTSLITSTAFQTTTVQVLSTATQYSTLTNTQTITKVVTGTILVTNSGSDDGSSQPFTATTTGVEIRLNITATASLNYVAVSWYIYQVGGLGSTCHGGRDSQQGSFTDYCYNLTTGVNYYVEVLAANANWQVAVLELK